MFFCDLKISAYSREQKVKKFMYGCLLLISNNVYYTNKEGKTTYTAIIIKESDWYAGFIKELPGANSQGKTMEEVIDNLKGAARLIVESNMKHKLEKIKDKIYEERTIYIQ